MGGKGGRRGIRGIMISTDYVGGGTGKAVQHIENSSDSTASYYADGQ